MGHHDFLCAVRGMLEAYAILGRCIRESLPPQLAAIAAVDPMTRVALEQLGDPLVHWFRRGSQLRGVHVADGTLIFDPGDSGAVHFIAHLAAEHDDELPPDWRKQAEVVARVDGTTLVIV